MITTARYKALQWFADHEEQDGHTKNLFARPPTARMRRLMAKEDMVHRKPVGQFGYEGWLLTERGREALAARYAKSRRRHERG